jgi:hypothetical protein
MCIALPAKRLPASNDRTQSGVTRRNAPSGVADSDN